MALERRSVARLAPSRGTSGTPCGPAPARTRRPAPASRRPGPRHDRRCPGAPRAAPPARWRRGASSAGAARGARSRARCACARACSHQAAAHELDGQHPEQRDLRVGHEDLRAPRGRAARRSARPRSIHERAACDRPCRWCTSPCTMHADQHQRRIVRRRRERFGALRHRQRLRILAAQAQHVAEPVQQARAHRVLRARRPAACRHARRRSSLRCRRRAIGRPTRRAAWRA